VTNEQLDQARAAHAFDQSGENDLLPDIAAHAARLAREGWMPLKAIEPDEEAALALWDEYNKEEIEGLEELVLEAIKRGRELERAEAKNLTIPGVAGHTDRNGNTSTFAVIVKSKNGGLSWTATPCTEATQPEEK
jgi:hypothetical protein